MMNPPAVSIQPNNPATGQPTGPNQEGPSDHLNKQKKSKDRSVEVLKKYAGIVQQHLRTYRVVQFPPISLAIV
jgi:hypothetical protein